MAAATQSKPRFVKSNANEQIIAIRLSSMTSDQIENVSYAANVDPRFPCRKPVRVSMDVVTPPTARCILDMSADADAAVPTSSTVCYQPVRVYTETGGDISGAVVDILLHFDGVSDGGGYII